MAELGVGDLLPAAAQRVMMFLSWVALATDTTMLTMESQSVIWT
jgi:hypothetical protein